jgi:hypothetical protein
VPGDLKAIPYHADVLASKLQSWTAVRQFEFFILWMRSRIEID